MKQLNTLPSQRTGRLLHLATKTLRVEYLMMILWFYEVKMPLWDSKQQVLGHRIHCRGNSGIHDLWNLSVERTTVREMESHGIKQNWDTTLFILLVHNFKNSDSFLVVSYSVIIRKLVSIVQITTRMFQLTSWVYTRTGIPKARANPKSASLITPLSSIKRFWGFKSLCRTLLEWQKTIPCKIWYK